LPAREIEVHGLNARSVPALSARKNSWWSSVRDDTVATVWPVPALYWDPLLILRFLLFSGSIALCR